jgi:hypothetical protein
MPFDGAVDRVELSMPRMGAVSGPLKWNRKTIICERKTS